MMCRLYHGQSKSGRYIRAFLSYGAFFSFEIRGSYLQIMNHLKDRYVQFVKSSYLLFFILCMVLGPYRRKNRNYSSHNHATLLFWFPSDRAVTTCTRARVLPDILLPCIYSSNFKFSGHFWTYTLIHGKSRSGRTLALVHVVTALSEGNQNSRVSWICDE